jgi:hypothetical protein
MISTEFFVIMCDTLKSRYSEYTMALGSTQHLTEINTRNLPGGKGQPEREADDLTANCELIV